MGPRGLCLPCFPLGRGFPVWPGPPCARVPGGPALAVSMLAPLPPRCCLLRLDFCLPPSPCSPRRGPIPIPHPLFLSPPEDGALLPPPPHPTLSLSAFLLRVGLVSSPTSSQGWAPNSPRPCVSLPCLPPLRPCCSKSDDFYTFGSIFLEKDFEREVRVPQQPEERGLQARGGVWVQATGWPTVPQPGWLGGGWGPGLALLGLFLSASLLYLMCSVGVSTTRVWETLAPLAC